MTAVDPTVSAGSARRLVSVTTTPGFPEGWMSIRTPYGLPFTI